MLDLLNAAFFGDDLDPNKRGTGERPEVFGSETIRRITTGRSDVSPEGGLIGAAAG